MDLKSSLFLFCAAISVSCSDKNENSVLELEENLTHCSKLLEASHFKIMDLENKIAVLEAEPFFVEIDHDLRIIQLVKDFAAGNNVDRRKCIITVSHTNQRKDFLDHHDVYISSYTKVDLPKYPDRYAKIDGYSVFFFTEFNSWLNQDILKHNFLKIVESTKLELSTDKLLVRNPNWRVKMMGDSVVKVEKRY